MPAADGKRSRSARSRSVEGVGAEIETLESPNDSCFAPAAILHACAGVSYFKRDVFPKAVYKSRGCGGFAEKAPRGISSTAATGRSSKAPVRVGFLPSNLSTEEYSMTEDRMQAFRAAREGRLLLQPMEQPLGEDDAGARPVRFGDLPNSLRGHRWWQPV